MNVVKNSKVLKVLIILIIFVSILFVNHILYLKEIIHLNRIGYSFRVSNEIYKNNNYDYIKENKYNKIIDKYIKNNDFNDNYIDIYYEIEYKDIDNLIVIINSLIDKGYSNNDINKILDNYEESFINYLLVNKVNDISNYLEYDYFNSKNIDRYLKYFNGDYKETIINVNIGLDKEYYENPNIVSDYNKTMIVNKYNKLSASYIPKNLKRIEKCANGEYYLEKDANEAFEILCEASIKDNMSISVSSAYRSYREQEEIYNYYLEASGEKYADTIAARPGFSEHQTGLAIDLVSLNSTFFIYSKEFAWMKENAHKYGYILRYEKDKEHITGYNAEAWHFRYVGEDIAKYIYENNITYEEYYAMNYKIKNDESNGYQKTTILKSNKAGTEVLVKFNDNLYGKSYGVIDYNKNPNGPVGVIDKLTDKENIPKYNGETNTKEMLNAQVDYVSESMLVLNYNNEYVLFEKIL